jgi:predicted ArsR family transcriptional regulator
MELTVSEGRCTFLVMETEIVYGAKRGAGKTRDMVLRYHLQGMTNVKIAQKVGISRQAVGAHLARLRAAGELPATTR